MIVDGLTAADCTPGLAEGDTRHSCARTAHVGVVGSL